MVSKTLFSSASDSWETPQAFFDKLDAEFRFVLDAAASAENAKCPVFFTKEMDALRLDWSVCVALKDSPLRGPVWLNSPYGRGITDKWIAKAAEQQAKGVTTVMLLPARTDTRAWFEYIHNHHDVEVRFVKGRLRFGGAKNTAPFPSAVVIFHGAK